MKRPSIRFSLRTLLIVTSAFAVVFAFAVANYQAWRNERAAIKRLNSLSYWHVFEISQDLLDQIPSDQSGYCSNVPAGASFTHDSVLPNFVSLIERRLGVDVFQRVTCISVYRLHDPLIVSELSNFGHLISIKFTYSPSHLDSRESEESEFLDAIRLFASLNPHIDVTWPDAPSSDETREFTFTNQDTGGIDDPFASPPCNDPRGTDPFLITVGADPFAADSAEN
ncbi:hypothetical protein SH528x_002665 [Novipirellula sp. SH528]|uniref:hypothetical protein n=1 Tax=Novipirellula sp. SH528 TaxID=3454466 RepID=UPI003FA0495B